MGERSYPLYKGGATHRRPSWFLYNCLGELGEGETHHMLTTEQFIEFDIKKFLA